MTKNNAASALRGGRKPLTAKRPVPVLSEGDLFGNALSLDPMLKAELDAQGLEGRFVDAAKLFQMGGYHPKGWTVYKRKTASGTMEFKFGNDPDGIVRRGSMILAVKSKDQAEKHRAFLRQKAELYSSVIPRQAEELRKMARDNNVDVEVDESYDEDSDKS